MNRVQCAEFTAAHAAQFATANARRANGRDSCYNADVGSDCHANANWYNNYHADVDQDWHGDSHANCHEDVDCHTDADCRANLDIHSRKSA